MMTKKIASTAAIAAGVGLCIAVALVLVAGIQYRTEEDQGLQPGYSPEWLSTGIDVGILAFALGVLVLLGVGIASLIHRRLPQSR